MLPLVFLQLHAQQAVVREVKEETGLDVKIVRKIGEYHEYGIHDGIENDYYPACYLVKSIGGSIKKRRLRSKKLGCLIFEIYRKHSHLFTQT